MLNLADHKTDLDGLELLDREDLIAMVKRMVNGGVSLSFHGKRTAMEISRKVRPRVTRRIKDLHVGTPEDQSTNLLIEGENLQAMVTLYKYRGEVDLIVTDPPYNTGQYFRYNDRWDEDPNDPELGTLVTLEDGSRHTKWMKAMLPRLQIMKSMLKPQGVVAMCIDANELFNLGLMMNEVFGEQNRIAIINWQKSAAPRSDNNHISTSTEYVLVYAKDIAKARTESLARSAKDDKRYSNPDNDPDGYWREGNLTARSYSAKDDYAIQSPFTGTLHYPAGNGAWRHPKKNILKWISEWGGEYEEHDIGDGKVSALMARGGTLKSVPSNISNKALARLKQDDWPFVWFGRDGQGRPRGKTYLEKLKKGKVPVTYWAEEDLCPVELDSTSWGFRESGRSSDGVSQLTSIVGKGHRFDTVKPLKLMSKIIQLWCPTAGVVMDPYAGSGTTGHAVLQLNRDTGADRRFILIEQGRPDNGDKYARTLTWQRLKNVVTGERPDKKGTFRKRADALGGGFEFRMLTSQIDAKTVLSMKTDELVDVVITSHWDTGSRNSPNLIRIEDPKFTYLVGKNQQEEGYFIIWTNGGPVGQLDVTSYNRVLQDAKRSGLKPPYNVYARYEVYQSKNVRFYKIPDKILAHLGLNEHSDPYNQENGEDGD